MGSEEQPKIELPIQKSRRVKAKQVLKKSRPYFTAFNIALTLTIFSTVFLFPYPNPFQVDTTIEDYTTEKDSKKTVLIQPQHRDVIFDNYDSDLEEGYCLFGEVNSTHIKIEKVIHNENPLDQGPNYIMNTCFKQIRNELPGMYLDYDYKLLGSIHTHPQSGVPEPSMRDIHSLGMKRLFVRVLGVANNNTVNFYSHKSLGMGLPVKYY